MSVGFSRFILPTTFSAIDVGMVLPCTLFHDKSIKVELLPFSYEEKLDFFNLESFSVNGTEVRWSSKNRVPWGFGSHKSDSEFLSGQYKIVVTIPLQESVEKDQEKLNCIKNSLNFALLIYGNGGLRHWSWESTRELFPDSIKASSIGYVVSGKKKLSVSGVQELGTLLGCILQRDKKIDDVRELFLIALREEKTSLRGLLLVVFLERIFLSDGSSGGNRYKFALRITKFFQKDMDFFKDMQKVYDKRSGFVHAGKVSEFSKEDILKLTDLVRKSLSVYVLEGEECFKNEKLDELLVGSS